MSQITEGSPNRRHILGISVLGFCLIAYTIMAEVSQYLQKSLHFTSPFFILWYSHSFYLLIFPIDLVIRKVFMGIDFSSSISSVRSQVEGIEKEYDDAYSRRGSLVYFGRFVLLVAVTLTMGAYLWYVAIGLTSMASLTTIYNTSCFFAYVFSVYGRLEPFNKQKAFSVIISILGVVVITTFGARDENTHDSFKGNVVVLASAVLIGLFEVIYKKYTVSEKAPTILQSNFTSSYIGLITFGLLWFPLPLLHYLEIEQFQIPDSTSLLLLTVNALMGVAYNAGLMVVISMTSPVFASVGIMVTIPLITCVDGIILAEIPGANVWIGGFIIALGFVILTHATINEKPHHTQPVSGPLSDELGPNSLSRPTLPPTEATPIIKRKQ
ncbi:hypothetical protein DSO57_1011707 [Entomophthora muscae]|uniref:Uncharacterized protein n=2 Tax=Entomophthora muscae TaxID=34485 RepID=A0ACC2SJM6_9FUNG|nr:hypothetical protein DSO57_1011707 [Entomophthora muscae]